MSKKYSLNQEDLKKILVGACIAVGGALLTYLTQVVANTDFGAYTPLVQSVASILIYTAKKLLEGK